MRFLCLYDTIRSFVQIFCRHLYVFLTVRKENEEMVNAISREEGSEHNNSTVKGAALGSSSMPPSL